MQSIIHDEFFFIQSSSPTGIYQTKLVHEKKHRDRKETDITASKNLISVYKEESECIVKQIRLSLLQFFTQQTLDT